MKLSGKRIMAFILTLCMLISVLPPVVMASGDGDGAGETPVTVTYDFTAEAINTATGGNYVGYTFWNNRLTNLDGYYEAGTLNWKIAASNSSLLVKDDVTKADSYLGYGNGTTQWDGLRLAMRLTKTDTTTPYANRHWFAFTLAAPGAGTYNAALNYETRGDASHDVKVYLLPGAMTDAAAIQAAMDASSSLTTGFDSRKDNNGTIANTSRQYIDSTVSLGEVTLQDGAYTLVVECAEDVGYYFFMNSLELEKTAGERVPEKITYDVTAAAINTATGGSYTGYSFWNNRMSALDSYYEAGTLNWKIAASNSSLLVKDDVTKADSYLGYGNGTTQWDGLRLAMRLTKTDTTSPYAHRHWFAFTLAAPGAGTYNAALNYETRGDASHDVKVYLLPGEMTDATAIQTAMDASSSLTTGFDSRKDNNGTIANTSRQYIDSTVSLGEVTLQDGAYTLVVECAEDVGYYFFMNGLELTEVIQDPSQDTTAPVEDTTAPVEDTTAPNEETTVPEQSNSLGYSFEVGLSDLEDTNGASMAGGILTQDKIRLALEYYYSEGTISWKYALDNIDTFATDNILSTATHYFGGGGNPWSGLKLGMMHRTGAEQTKTYPAGYWVAFTVKSPGAGNYKITLDYQTRKDATPEGEVYILPGTYTTVEAVETVLTRDNLRKVVDFTSNSYTFEAPVSADLGVMTLAEGEYTVVFKAAKAKVNAYMYLNELHFEKTDAPENTPDLPEVQEPVVPKPEGYTFQLGTSSLVNSAGASFAEAILSEAKNLDALEKYYAENYISWKYSLDNISSFANADKKLLASNTFYFGGGGNPWTGLKLGMMLRDQSGESEVRTYPSGWWTAFTLKSPGAGTFEIKLDYQVRADGTTAGEIYLVKGTFTDAKALEAQLTKENLLKSVDFSSKTYTLADASRSLGIVTFENCEYTLVVKAAEGKPGAAYAYLNGLSFTPSQPKPVLGPVQTGKLVYDFQLGTSQLTTLDGKTMAGGILDSKGISEALGEYFEDQKIYWKYAADNLDSFNAEGASVSSTFFIGGTETYKWAGMRSGVKVTGPDVNAEGKKVGHYPAGWYLAMNIHAPGTGTYHLTLDYQSRADATTAAEIYLIKGSLTDPAQIEKQLTAENLVSTVDMKGKTFDLLDKSVYLGAYAFEQGQYTLVVKAAADNGSGTAAYTYLTKLTADTQAPPEPTEIIYDFDLCDKTNGIWNGKKMLMESTGELAKLYANGKLNWKYESKAFSLGDDAHAFADHYGMVMYTNQEQWMAFRIKSPGSGTYTLSLNHAISGRGAMGAVYVLPGDATDIEAAMDYSNRVGKVQFYNQTGSTDIENDGHTTLGTWTFEKGKEYIVVFEALTSTVFQKNIGYMWISQLIAKKGDHTAETVVTDRVVKPLVVDPEPVKTMELNLYMTTSEINGQDYLFVGTEGHQLFVCNLEDMVRERIVRTPFGISRAMTTDKDGMIWVGGDAAVLWRYDPYTNTSMTTRNYKLSGGIDDTSSAFSMTSDEEGNIYFGSYSKGYIVKYDPRTDEFSKVGGDAPLNPDCQYSCGVVVQDGYLYAALSGDLNADGQRTAEVVKVDLATNKLVGRTDIYKQFGDKEVMVRGAGICGDTLFMGGISMEGFIAIDINTMELKDYGIPKQINYAPSEVVDGKCYMRVQDYGMYEYDSATDTMTKVKNMDTASVGFRTTPHSAVTLSNNPLFPGISHVTASSTGIKIYNFETKNVWTPPLYDEDLDGAGQLIRCLVRGEEGDPNVYAGAFNTVNCAKFNTETGETSLFEATSAQTDVMLWHEGKLYVGNYNAGNLVQINFDDPERNVILLKFKEQYHQARVHAIAAGDGYIFASTIPDSFLYGGCLAIIDLKTQARTVEENLIENQCITSLAYHDGIIIGGTSVSGGTGTSGSATGKESAVIFAYDVETKKLLATLDLRDYFPELPDMLPYINGLTADPDIAENGKYWGLISETLFSFSFDKTTNTFSVKEELSFDKKNMPTNIGRTWDDCSWAFDGEGYMYVAFDGNINAGMRKINMANPKENTRIDIETPRVFTLGPDGNLYYSANNPILKMFPLNVTEDDWQSAEAVDKMILAIGDKITLDSEEKIVAARAAYEALSLKHKALVQNLEILQIAETDLLECKIDVIGEVTLEKRELIESLLAQYNAMSSYEQRFVKNYELLSQADMTLQGLINEQVAAEMQKIIDAMKDAASITLDDYDYVMGIKEQYDALKFLQRQLVDATKLEAALAKIQELRQEKIEYLKKLIASIGEVTLEDEAVIMEAVEIFDWLTLDEREQVDYITLNAAEKALKKLQKAAAEEVDALIEAIGEVKRSSGKAIEAARNAYDVLTEGSKAYVKLLDTLLAAEAAYAELGGLGVVGTVAIVAAVLAAGGIGVTLVMVKKPQLLKKKQKAAPDAGTEE